MKQLYINTKNITQYNIKHIKHYLSQYTALEIALTTIILLFGLWFSLSFIDIISHNLTTYTYTSWNLIIILSDLF